MRAMSLLESDQTPSTYWITNPDNIFEDNVAAGGDGFGFWMNLPRHPGGFLSFTGATFSDDIFPRHTPLGSFKRNTAHGYRIGFLAHDLDPKEFDKRLQVKRKRDGWTRQWFKMVDETAGLRRATRFEHLLAYSNSEAGGTFADLGHVTIHDFVAAQGVGGQTSGLETLQYKAEQWGDASNGWNAPMVTGSLFIGPGASADAARGTCGFSGPMSSFLTLSDSAFHGFGGKAAAICACKICNGLKGGQEVRTSNLRFSSVGPGSRLKFQHHFEAIFNDLDGSLTGGAPGSWMHALADDGSMGHFPPSHCAPSGLGSSRSGAQAIVCDAGVSLRTFRFRDVQPQENFLHRSAVVTTAFGASPVPWMVYDILIRTSSHHFTLVNTPGAGIPHKVDFTPNMAFPTDNEGWTQGEVCELRADESALIQMPTLTNPNRWRVADNEVAFPTASLGPLETFAPSRRLNGFWAYEPATGGEGAAAHTLGLLQMVVAPRTGGANFPDGSAAKPACSASDEGCHEGQRCVKADLKRFDCSPSGCFLDTDSCLNDSPTARSLMGGGGAAYDWCTPSAGWSVPAAGANVTIPQGVKVTLSGCTTAILNQLNVYGTLEFVDGSASVLRATHIHVAADTGRLQAGTLASPFLSSARIELYGHRLTPPYPNSGLGSKFLAVFGELSLVGAPLPAGGSLHATVQMTAESGSRAVTLESGWASALGLGAGDTLLLAPSGLVWNESELVTIDHVNASVAGDGYVDAFLSAPLSFSHVGVINASFLGTPQPGMAAEVALTATGDGRLLNVVVEGMDDEQGAVSAGQYGASTYIMQRTQGCPGTRGSTIPAAAANVSGVAFRSCGQRGWRSRGCLTVRPHSTRPRSTWDTMGRVKVVASAFVGGFAPGVQFDRVHGATLDGNVVADVKSVGIHVEGQRNKVTNNLVTEVADGYAESGSSLLPWAMRFGNGDGVEGIGIQHAGRGSELTGNRVAGVDGMAMLTDGHECGATRTVAGNTVHSAIVGVFYAQRLKGATGADADGQVGVSTREGYPVGASTRTTCYELDHFFIHSTLLYGAHSGRMKGPETRGSASTLVYRNFTLIDTGVALSHTSEGPDSTHNEKTRPDLHWKVVGATVLASSYRCGQAGFVAATFHNVNTPWGPLHMDNFGIRQAPSLYGGSVLQDSFFDGFGIAEASFAHDARLGVSCGAGHRNVAISDDYATKVGDSNPGTGEAVGEGFAGLNTDASNPLTVSGLTFGSSVDAGSRYRLRPADPSFIGDSGCAQIDCDGRRNMIVIDQDGSLLLSGSPGTAISKNEIRFTDPLTYVDPLGANTPADLLPTSMTTSSDGSAISASSLYPNGPGTSRGGCSWSSAADAYECTNGGHRQLIVEDITRHRMENRIAPVGLLVDGYISLATGPQNNHGAAEQRQGLRGGGRRPAEHLLAHGRAAVDPRRPLLLHRAQEAAAPSARRPPVRVAPRPCPLRWRAQPRRRLRGRRARHALRLVLRPDLDSLQRGPRHELPRPRLHLAARPPEGVEARRSHRGAVRHPRPRPLRLDERLLRHGARRPRRQHRGAARHPAIPDQDPRLVGRWPPAAAERRGERGARHHRGRLAELTAGAGRLDAGCRD